MSTLRSLRRQRGLASGAHVGLVSLAGLTACAAEPAAQACQHGQAMHETIGEDLRGWARSGDVSVEIVTVAAHQPEASLDVQHALVEAVEESTEAG